MLFRIRPAHMDIAPTLLLGKVQEAMNAEGVSMGLWLIQSIWLFGIVRRRPIRIEPGNCEFRELAYGVGPGFRKLNDTTKP